MPGGGAHREHRHMRGAVRIRWQDLPDAVRAAIEAHLGAPVILAVNQPGGMSSGLAARVRCEGGRRAFVKAAAVSVNAGTVRLHRHEARTAAALPDGVPVPRLRHVYDDGDWVALIFDEFDGAMPEVPWRPDQLQTVLAAVADMSARLTPCPVPDVPELADHIRADMLAYSRLAADPPEDLDDWERRHLDRLAEHAASALGQLVGDTLVHLDIRSDNILIAADGSVAVVDWAWASRGPRWVDCAMLVLEAQWAGVDVGTVHWPEPDPDVLTAFVAGLAGMWATSMRRRAPADMPTIRAVQRAQHDVALSWVHEHTGW
ncbi:MAG: aminoglycoside phosphotransferase [Pseudonocardiales bacterium]|nr:MAG: aminoglycoside phosphotransferase [Pseudonocardiales bacterium]